MEAATKKKRGRPRTFAGSMGRDMKDTIFVDDGLRAATNKYYAMEGLQAYYGELDKAENGSFFISDNRKVRRQGIAEQLGRMLVAELITTEQAKELAQWAIDTYNNGTSVKQIESTLRLYRQTLQKAESQN